MALQLRRRAASVHEPMQGLPQVALHQNRCWHDGVFPVYKRAMWQLAIVGMLGLVLAGCAETPRQRANRFEPMLSAAGFHMAPADTPQRQQELASHTPLKMRYYFANGKPHYWLADPYVCNCVYIGDEADFQRYQQLKLQQQLVERDEAAAAMNENAVEAEQFNGMMWAPSPYFY